MRVLIPLVALPLAAAAAPIAPPSPADPVEVTSIPAVQRSDSIVITEWTVPWERTRPRDPYFDATSGDVWFVGQVGNYVARLNPATGEFRRYELEERALPHNLIVDDRGTVWYAGNGNGHIGKLDPNTGAVTRIAMPDSSLRDPHTLTFGRDGNIWFTAQGGGSIGWLNTTTGELKHVTLTGQRTRPYGIEVDSRNRAWVNVFGTNKIAVVEPGTMEVREYTLPHADARSRRIAVTSDDMVWYVDYARGQLARLDPGSGEVAEYALPGGERSQPYAMAHDDRGRIWVVETGVAPNRLIGFDPSTQQIFSNTPIRSSTDGNGRNTVRHMMYHAPTRSIWFGTDANTIGRALVP